MGDKLPDGWWRTGATWTTENGAIAVVGGCAGGKVNIIFHGPPRSTLDEAEQDRLNLIAGLEGDTVSQLLRDSMRVTQEESIRLKADMARKDAEIASLRQRVAASETYAQHLLAALNAASGFKRMP